MKSFIALFLFSLNLYGQEQAEQVVPLPASVMTIDEIVNEFRETTTTKMDDISKNFISIINGKIIAFTNSSPTRCNGLTTPVGQPVAVVNNKSSELIEKTVYTGCNNAISLVEDVVTRGADLKSLEYKDFIKGKRSFDLSPNETYKYYRLSNSDNEEIFKLIIERTPTGKIAEMFIVESKFLTISYEYLADQTKLVFRYNGYKGKYSRKFSSWEFDRLYDPFSNTVIAKKTDKFVETSFFDTRGIRFTQKDFLTRIDDYLLGGPVKRLREFLEYHNYYFPSTEVVKASGQNEHLKEELRLAFNRLQNNTELNLVKKQIQEYIEAVNSGLIIDKRPKQ